MMVLVISQQRLHDLARRLVEVEGVVGVMLGGSRARGTADPDSDVDLGLYYRPPLHTAGLRSVAEHVAQARTGPAQPAEVELTEPGGWGPWVDGGGWLTIDETPVDWIYRDLDRVAASVDAARAGQLGYGLQTGHPFGFADVAYAGELALGVVLADPGGELAALRRQVEPYPVALHEAYRDALWEASFLLGALTKPAGRGDVTYVAGCLFRVITLCAYAICARAGCWVINEKGVVALAGGQAGAPSDFAVRAHAVLAGLGTGPASLREALAAAAELVAEIQTA